MTKILSPEQLRRTKQIVSTDDLIKIAEHNGFAVREGNGGSHIIMIHDRYPDVIIGLIAKTKKTSSQRELSDALKVIRKRDNAITKKFQLAAQQEANQRLENIREQLPDYVEAFYGDSEEIILRDRQFPQIGVTLHSPEEDRLLENKIHNELHVMKRSFAELLGRSQTQYDMDAVYDENRQFTGHLSHSIYDMEDLYLPPYPEAADPITALVTYQNKIEEIDLDHALRKEYLLNKPFIVSDIFVSAPARRGERHNHVSYILSDKENPLSFTFKTYSNQRVHGDGLYGRISENELQKIESIIDGIEKKLAATQKRLNHRELATG